MILLNSDANIWFDRIRRFFNRTADPINTVYALRHVKQNNFRTNIKNKYDYFFLIHFQKLVKICKKKKILSHSIGYEIVEIANTTGQTIN